MTEPLSFPSLVDVMSTRVARAVINQMRARTMPFREHLRQEFEPDRRASAGASLPDPIIESMFGYELATETFGDLGGKLLHPKLVAAMASPAKEQREHAFPLDRHPYRHQIEAWTRLKQKEPQSIVVASGIWKDRVLPGSSSRRHRSRSGASGPLTGVRAPVPVSAQRTHPQPARPPSCLDQRIRIVGSVLPLQRQYARAPTEPGHAE